MPQRGSAGLETRLLILRHGETTAPDRFHGAESDIGLSATGIRQAEAIAEVLAAMRPDAVLSSPMRRALDTARPIARACGVELEQVPEIHERRMGELSGTLKTEGWAKYAEEKAHWIAGELNFARDDAETFAEARDRVVGALERLVASRSGQTLVVVSHGIVIRVLLASLLPDLSPADFDRIGIDNTAINDLRWDGKRWRAERLHWLPQPPERTEEGL